MDPANKRDAQRRVERIRAFREELEELRSEGVLELTGDQQARLEAHLAGTLRRLAGRFDVDITESEKQISWGMRIASTVAGLALCAAVVLFFYRIWGAISIPFQVALLMATPLAAAGAMEYASRRERTLYYTALLGIIAFAAAVLNLNALAGIFNVTPSPNAFLVWAAFGFGLAYAYGLRLLLAAGLVCGMLFIDMKLTQLSGFDWSDPFLRAESLVAAGAAAVAAPSFLKHPKLDDFPWVYRMLGLLAVLGGMVLLSLNARLSYLPLAPRNVEIGYQLAGMTAAAAAMWRGIVHGMRGIVNLAAVFFAVFLYIRLYEWWWDWMPKYLFFLVIGLISLALLFLFQRLRGRMRKERAQ